MHNFLLRMLNKLYVVASHPFSFLFILLTVIMWFGVGTLMNFDEHWYRIAHVFEIVVTLLMLFLIENTQQADMRALQEKLDEIIKKLPHTDDAVSEIEKKYKGEV